MIARHFLQQYSKKDGKRFTGFTPEAEAALMAYQWPGNVRELQNTVRNIVVLNDGQLVELAMFPRQLQGLSPAPATRIAAHAVSRADPPSSETSSRPIEPLDTIVRRVIEQAIARCGSNIPKAAAALQVSPSTIYRRLQAWQAEPPAS